MLRNIPASLVWAIAICSSGCAMGQQAPLLHEQMTFSAEDESVQQPVKIPHDVWAFLQKDGNVLEVLNSQDLQPNQLSASWFTASEVHLDGSQENDLVVVGKNLLQGANVTTFWVFTRGISGTKLVLSVPAHDLAIETNRTKG